MPVMSPLDAVFLIPETREQPMHVGSLELFTTPEGAGRDFLADLYQRLLAIDEIAPLFRKRPHRSLATLGQWTWQYDDAVDLEHHVRHSALPRPGRVRELLALVSRLHGSLLDRRRPLWEMHLIEGLSDGRFAIYFKVHHALLDGVAGLRLLQHVLTEDADDRALRAPYLPLPSTGDREKTDGNPLSSVAGLATTAIREVTSLPPAALHLGQRLLHEQAAALPSLAPRTILNDSITGARRFAAQSWQLSRLRAAAGRTGATLNDIVLAMCAGALRRYLDELDALPDSPLVAMVPVSLREVGAEAVSGNAVGLILCNLATDEPDPHRRLEAIQRSTRQGKQMLAGMSRLQITAMSALAMAPLALGMVPGAHRLVPLPFNLIISNVPGPRRPLWMCGAQLEAFYPLSIPTNGQALNITVTSYADHMEFGLTGCRRTMPHLQHLLAHLETSLAELEPSEN
ncbi:MAG TPA: wax ester/triacylglycerol synthase family O-acyltransferase [Mycobacteriales bacterium]|nr:wax ester/triacylglycerol synthase family O-acyltransferase [Mycobacteriales bacterium]